MGKAWFPGCHLLSNIIWIWLKRRTSLTFHWGIPIPLRRKREVYPVLRSFAKIHHFLTVSSGFTGWWFPIVMALTVSIQDGRYQETRRGWCSTLGRLWSKEGANMLQTMVNLEIYTNIYSVVVWNHGILWLSIHLGMASSQLTNFTNIFQRGRYTTNQYIYIYIYNIIYIYMVEGSLEVKLPTIWTDEKQSRAEAERRERLEERRVEEKESEERRCRCAKR